MRRRGYLAGSVAVVASLAGCAGILGDSSSSEGNGPTAIASAFLEAVFAGSVDEADDYVHAESQMKGQLGAVVDTFTEQATRLEDTMLSEESETTAVVDAETSLAVAGSDSRVSSRLIVIMQRVDGSWRVDMLTTPGFGGGGPSAPSMRWESRERTAADGTTTAVVFEHTGGDTFDGSTLSVSVGDARASAPMNAGTVETGVQIVAPVDAAGSSTEAGTSVALEWSDPDSETTQTLTSYVLEEATAGALADRIQVE